MTTAAAPPTEGARKGYGAGARILSVGIATTGVVTFAYFSLASHALSDTDYSHISLLSRHGEVVEARSPFPWTMLLVRL